MHWHIKRKSVAYHGTDAKPHEIVGQCTYNATLRRVRVTTIVMEKQ
jgi:hypothetical protein